MEYSDATVPVQKGCNDYKHVEDVVRVANDVEAAFLAVGFGPLCPVDYCACNVKDPSE